MAESLSVNLKIQKGHIKWMVIPLYVAIYNVMIEQIEKEIKELLDSDVTSYLIYKKTGVAIPIIDRYRKGDNKLENMTLKIAKKLLTFKGKA